MATDGEQRELALLVHAKAEHDYSGADSNRFSLTFVHIHEDGKIRNIESDGALSDLEIRGAQSTDFDCEAYAWHCTYHDPYSVELPRARLMVKTLERIERGLAKIEGERGCAQDFGEYVARVAHALGVKRVVWTVGEARRWSYDSTEHRIVNVGEGIDHIRHMARAWRQEHPYHNRYAQSA